MAEIELVVTPSQLDTHPFLLNFLNGTLNLETGELLPHTREHFITKIVHYNYNPDAQCPAFRSFLAQIMGCNPDASLNSITPSWFTFPGGRRTYA
jgi:putative DNA primase/helicase